MSLPKFETQTTPIVGVEPPPQPAPKFETQTTPIVGVEPPPQPAPKFDTQAPQIVGAGAPVNPAPVFETQAPQIVGAGAPVPPPQPAPKFETQITPVVGSNTPQATTPAPVGVGTPQQPGLATSPLKSSAADPLPLLHKAKALSDVKDYRGKANILHSLMAMEPDEWMIDQDDGGHIVGITHRPTGYRYHLPRKEVTPGVGGVYYHGSPKSGITELLENSWVTPDRNIAYQMGRFYTDSGKTWTDDDLQEPYAFKGEPKWKADRVPDGEPTIYRLLAAADKLNKLDNPYEHRTLTSLPVEPDEQHKEATLSLKEMQALAVFLNTNHGAGIDLNAKADMIEAQVLRFLGLEDSVNEALYLTGVDGARKARKQMRKVATTGGLDPIVAGNVPQQTDSQESDKPLTGPEAIAHALGKIDMDALENEQREIVRSKKATKRPRAIAVLNTLQGLRRNNLKPSDLMIKSIPVIPPVYRPYLMIGSTFQPGDANQLYQDVMRYRDTYKESVNELGYAGSADARLALYDATKALYGYGDSPNPKLQKRGVAGFLAKITGTSPKTGYVQSKLLGKPLDMVSRGTVTVDPELSLDEIGVPEELAWKMYREFAQRYMVRNMGISPAQAVQALVDRSKEARHALDKVMEDRPVVYTRAPAWHKFNTLAGRAKIVDGSSIHVNPFITSGMGMDFDGDAINLHVPAMQKSVEEAREKLMPSKMVWSPRKMDTIVPTLKHEQVLPLFSAQKRPAQNKHVFATESEALKAIETGKVKLSDEVEIAGQPQQPG